MTRYTIRLLVCGFLLFSSSPLLAGGMFQLTEEHPVSTATKQEEDVVQWAQDNLPQTGVLTEGKRGFVYLKVDDDYINRLFSMLQKPGYSKPVYFRRPNAPGAHISVFYVDERNQTGEIKEIGQKYTFKIIGIDLVPPRSREYIVLKVESPELEQLREKYGLSPHLKGHEFHITLAKKQGRNY